MSFNSHSYIEKHQNLIPNALSQFKSQRQSGFFSKAPYPDFWVSTMVPEWFSSTRGADLRAKPHAACVSDWSGKPISRPGLSVKITNTKEPKHNQIKDWKFERTGGVGILFSKNLVWDPLHCHVTIAGLGFSDLQRARWSHQAHQVAAAPALWAVSVAHRGQAELQSQIRLPSSRLQHHIHNLYTIYTIIHSFHNNS